MKCKAFQYNEVFLYPVKYRSPQKPLERPSKEDPLQDLISPPESPNGFLPLCNHVGAREVILIMQVTTSYNRSFGVKMLRLFQINACMQGKGEEDEENGIEISHKNSRLV